MQNLFIILNYLSILVMFVSLIILVRQAASQMQKLALVVTFSLLSCCLGFLFNSEALTIEEFILSQKLKYAFITFGMYYMLLFIMEYCHYRLSNVIRYLCLGLNLLVSFVVLTLEYHSLFYKTCWIVENNGHFSLEKEYGFFHTIAVAMFMIYMIAAVVIAIYFAINNVKKRSKYVWRLLFAVSLPCLSYIVPKILDIDNDMQPIAFAAFIVMVIVMVYKNNLYDVDNIAANYSLKSNDEAIIVLDNSFAFKGCNDIARSLFSELNNINIDESINGVSRVLDSLIQGQADDYAYNNQIYGVSVTPVIGENGEKMGKVVRFKNVTIERNYTKLLKDTNQNLASQVVTLSNYSYKDELTGCSNRRYYEECIETIRKSKSIDNISVWTMDINGLKEANDNIGHHAGDELIKGTALVLEETFGNIGQVFRTGGDEFYVIIQGQNVDNKKLADNLDNNASNWHGTNVDKLSISYGYVEGDNNQDKTIDELMIEADKLMYENKRQYYLQSGIDRRHNY